MSREELMNALTTADEPAVTGEDKAEAIEID